MYKHMILYKRFIKVEKTILSKKFNNCFLHMLYQYHFTGKLFTPQYPH